MVHRPQKGKTSPNSRQDQVARLMNQRAAAMADLTNATHDYDPVKIADARGRIKLLDKWVRDLQRR